MFAGSSKPSAGGSLDFSQDDLLLESSLYCLKQVALGTVKVNREIDFIASVTSISAHLGQLRPAEIAVQVIPYVAAGLRGCDFSGLGVLDSTYSVGKPQPAFLDPVFTVAQLVQGVQKRVHSGCIDPNKAAFELLGSIGKILSAGPSMVAAVSERAASLSYTPI